MSILYLLDAFFPYICIFENRLCTSVRTLCNMSGRPECLANCASMKIFQKGRSTWLQNYFPPNRKNVVSYIKNYYN